MTFFSIFFLFLPSSSNEEHFRDLFISLAIIRCTFMAIVMIFGTGVAVQIFNYHSINWLYLFEVDPHSKMTNAQLYKVSSVLFFVWSSCFCMTIIQIKLQYVFCHTPAFFMYGLALFMLVYFLQPFLKCGYRKTRYQLWYSSWNSAIAPIGRCRFRDFFYCDSISSLSKPLEDMSYMLYFIATDEYRTKYYPNANNPWVLTLVIVV